MSEQQPKSDFYAQGDYKSPKAIKPNIRRDFPKLKQGAIVGIKPPEAPNNNKVNLTDYTPD